MHVCMFVCQPEPRTPKMPKLEFPKLGLGVAGCPRYRDYLGIIWGYVGVI